MTASLSQAPIFGFRIRAVRVLGKASSLVWLRRWEDLASGVSKPTSLRLEDGFSWEEPKIYYSSLPNFLKL